MITASEWQQEMVEGPVCHAYALGTRREICEPEVNPQEDTRVDDVPRGIREAVVPADFLHCLGRGLSTSNTTLSVPKNSSRVRVMAPVTLFAPEV